MRATWLLILAVALGGPVAHAQPYRLGDKAPFKITASGAENGVEERPAFIPVPNDGNAKLLQAAEQGDVRAVRRLLAAGADPSAKRQEYGEQTALMLAVGSRDPRMVEALVEAGARLEQTGSLPVDDRTVMEQVTPLALAVMQQDGANARYLVGRGARPLPPVMVRKINPTGQVTREEQPLILMAKKPEVATALIDAGADPNERGPDNRTALERALASGNRALANALVAGGADPHASGNRRKGVAYPVSRRREPRVFLPLLQSVPGKHIRVRE